MGEAPASAGSGGGALLVGEAALDASLGVGFTRSASAMLVLDAALRVVRVNPAASQLLGMSPTELAGQLLTGFCADDPSRQAAQAACAAACDPEPTVTRAVQLRFCAGAAVAAELDISLVPVPSGQRFLLAQVRPAGAAAASAAAGSVFADGPARYRQLAENLPGSAVALFDPELRLLLVAGEAVRANGSDPEGMTGLPLRESVTPEVLAVIEGPYQAAVQGRSTELEFTDPGSGRAYRMRVRPVTDTIGAVVAGLSVTEDVTADRARVAQLEQIRTLTSLGSCSYTHRGGWVIDPELLDLWGFTGPFDGQRFRRELIVPEDRDRVNADWDSVYAGGGQITTHYRMHHGITGQLRHLQTTMTGVVDQDRTLVSAVATHVDVTGAVTAREVEITAKAAAAAQRTALLRQVSDTLGAAKHDLPEVAQDVTNLAAAVLGEGAVLRILAPDLISSEQDFVTHRDPDALPALAAALAASTGIRAELIRAGKLVSSIHPHPDHDLFARNLSDRVGEPVQHFIVAPVRHEGAVLGLLGMHRTDPNDPYQPGDDDMVQVLADRVGSEIAAARAHATAEQERAGRDAVTEQLRTAAREQQQLLEQLADTETRERTLLAEAVHDDPLQLIVAAILRVDLLRLALPTEQDQEMDNIATLLETSVEQLRQLIIALTPMNLDDGLTPALRRLAQGIFIGTTVTVHTTGPDHVPLTPPVKATAYRIIREALVNARKHARATTITITVTVDQGAVSFTVTDDGTGSPALDAGPGHLGLATMRSRARTENGDLHITSTPGTGTTITLTLPTHDPHSENR